MKRKLLMLVLVVLVAGCAPSSPRRERSYTAAPASERKARGGATPDNSLPYYTRLREARPNWLSQIITERRRQMGFTRLQVRHVLEDVKRAGEARPLLARGDAALHNAVQRGLVRVKLVDAMLRQNPNRLTPSKDLKTPSPEVEGSWIIFDELRVARPL